jgi:multisubunit Na+/H+ antiporter MnhB subunit
MNDFFSNFYELLGSSYIEGFSDNLYDASVYTSTGIATLAVTILGTIVFYLLKAKKPLTFRRPAWFIWTLVLCVICFGIAYALSNSALYGVYAEQNQDLPYGFGNFAGFALINFLWAAVICVLTSFVIQLVRINTHGDVPFRFRKSLK